MHEYKVIVESGSSLRNALERLSERVNELVNQGYESYGRMYVQQAGPLWVVWKETEKYADYHGGGLSHEGRILLASMKFQPVSSNSAVISSRRR